MIHTSYLMIILYALPPGAVNMVHQCVGPPPPPSLFTHHSLLLTSLSLREIIVGVCEEGGARTRWWLCDR